MKITATLKNDRQPRQAAQADAQPTGKRYATHKATANGKRETIARRQARAMKTSGTAAPGTRYTTAGRAR